MVALDRIGRQIAGERCNHAPQVERVVSAARAAQAGERVTYSGGECRVVVRRGGAQAAEHPVEVELQGTHPRLPSIIAAGASTMSVIKALGVPHSMRGDEMIYALSDDEPDKAFVAIRLKDGKVFSLTWRWAGD
jgi:hypothetical protein